MKKEPELLTKRGNGEYKQKIIATIKGMRGQKEAAGESTSQTQYQQKKSEILARLRAEVLKTPIPTATPEQRRAMVEIVRLKTQMPTDEPKTSEQITDEQREAMAEIARLRGERQAVGEEELERVWRSNPDLQKEFVSFGSYQAYMKAKNQGRAKIIGSRTVKA